MNLKKRLLFLCAAVIISVPIYYNVGQSSRKGLSYVDGWNQNTSKNINDYISETLEPHFIPTDFCQKKGLLLVIVNVRPGNFDAREAIRETWAQKRDNVAFYFLVGELKEKDPETRLRLNHERRKYNDLIQERFIDSYNNLTLKSVNMLKLFHLHCAESYKYLMKIDDDVFLNIENVLEMLLNRTSTKNLLVGKVINNTKPFRIPTSKWYVPYELYPEEHYPPYLCGPLYVMSRDVAEKLYRCALETPLFHIEDVYVTGICAKKMNVIPKHDSGFKCEELKKYICLHRKLYSLHYYQPEEMRVSFQTLKENSCPPVGSLWETIHSVFFF